MFAKMPRHKPRIQIVSTAGTVADDNADLIVAVEICDRIRKGARPGNDKGHCDYRQP
jgi:hypothetical protein